MCDPEVERCLAVLRGLEAEGRPYGPGWRMFLERWPAPRTGDTVLVYRSGVPSFESFPVVGQGRWGVWLVGAMRVRVDGPPDHGAPRPRARLRVVV